jgi:hypothetical protein
MRSSTRKSSTWTLSFRIYSAEVTDTVEEIGILLSAA